MSGLLLFGGALTDLFGWRWIFFSNLPPALGAAWRRRWALPAVFTTPSTASLPAS
ncbi:hypothetical protein IQ251_15860 [Saccharopolyspora sp. HNM0983]|uniref:Major facilitator superfamily (MFS) profile domain-containing protein n=1 Tax=Saccharopolyspora montiporae TaxID=2781240 RepID=A0A929BEB5_9PSEU|nr:hypothetical protein [Saccharopolyspora sp. HNM0983]MBE9375927.1 hypothetical protein [Saccharopolyspora sp. HNM0983]